MSEGVEEPEGSEEPPEQAPEQPPVRPAVAGRRPGRAGKLPRIRVMDPGLQRYLDALAATVEMREGERGNREDAFVSWRELEGAGAVRRRAGGAGAEYEAVPPPPPMGLPNYLIPPELTGVAVAAAIQNVVLSWDYPGNWMGNFALVNIYRAVVDDYSEAIKVGEGTGQVYVDAVGPGQAYYYWLTITNTGGIEGPVHQIEGVYAETGVDAEHVLDELEDQIGEEQLRPGLRDRIDLIDFPGTGLVSQSAAMQSEIEAINAQLADIGQVQEFDESVSYEASDVVTFDGGMYQALQAMTAPSPDPTDAAYWEKVGDYASFADAISAHAVQLENHESRVTNNEGVISAHATEIGALQAGLTAAEGDIQGNATTLSGVSAEVTLLEDEVTSVASSVDTLNATVTGLEGDVGSKASVAYVDDAVSAEAAARATAVSTLNAAVDDNVAAIETKAEVSAVNAVADDLAPIKAQWSVKSDVNGLVGGIGLLNDGTETVFTVDANRFRITDDGTAPFVVENGQTYIRNTLIQNATISSAQIENGFLDNLTAVKGTLAQARIQRGNIFNLTVSGAIAGGAWPNSGFLLTHDGHFQLRTASSGARIEQDANSIRVYDSAGQLRVAMGNIF